MALAHTDLFALMAEVSAAFVGFSLVIGLLQPSHPGAAVRLNIMRAVAELAMISGGGAILVLILHEFGMPSELHSSRQLTVRFTGADHRKGS
jgi:hypothetical protein